jgi:hypothetical protein
VKELRLRLGQQVQGMGETDLLLTVDRQISNSVRALLGIRSGRRALANGAWGRAVLPTHLPPLHERGDRLPYKSGDLQVQLQPRVLVFLGLAISDYT